MFNDLRHGPVDKRHRANIAIPAPTRLRDVVGDVLAVRRDEDSQGSPGIGVLVTRKGGDRLGRSGWGAAVSRDPENLHVLLGLVCRQDPPSTRRPVMSHDEFIWSGAEDDAIVHVRRGRVSRAIVRRAALPGLAFGVNLIFVFAAVQEIAVAILSVVIA